MLGAAIAKAVLESRAATGARRALYLRALIQAAAVRRQLTPEVVTAFAELHLRTAEGVPIRPAAHHELWLKLMCDERIQRLLIIAPPEAAKTTWLVLAYAGCYIGFWPQNSVILASVTDDVAVARSIALRTMVRSDAWRRTFPDIEPARGMEWHDNHWSLAPGGDPFPGRLHPTVAAHGTGGDIVSARGHLIIPDDLINFENSRTPHQRDLVDTWFDSSLVTRLVAGVGRIAMIGTSWHAADLYAKARKRGGWVVCHTPIMSQSEEVYAFLAYPDNWPHEVLGEPFAPAEDLGLEPPRIEVQRLALAEGGRP